MVIDANNEVRIIQKWIGAETDGMWGPDTNAHFTEAVRLLQADLGISTDGWVGEETISAFEQAIADGRMNPEFGAAVIALYEGGAVDAQGNVVGLNSLHGRLGQSLHDAPLVATEDGGYRLEGGAGDFDLRSVLAEAPPPSPSVEPVSPADLQLDTQPLTVRVEPVSTEDLPLDIQTLSPAFNAEALLANPFAFQPQSIGETLSAVEARLSDTAAHAVPTLDAGTDVMARFLAEYAASTDGRLSFTDAALAHKLYESAEPFISLQSTDIEKIVEFAARSGLDANSEFDATDPDQLSDLLAHLVAYAHDGVVDALPNTVRDAIRDSAYDQLGIERSTVAEQPSTPTPSAEPSMEDQVTAVAERQAQDWLERQRARHGIPSP